MILRPSSGSNQNRIAFQSRKLKSHEKINLTVPPARLPLSIILPVVGLSAAVPQKCDGVLRLPPMSDPNPKIEPPWARRQASPPEDPPGVLRHVK